MRAGASGGVAAAAAGGVPVQRAEFYPIARLGHRCGGLLLSGAQQQLLLSGARQQRRKVTKVANSSSEDRLQGILELNVQRRHQHVCRTRKFLWAEEDRVCTYSFM